MFHVKQFKLLIVCAVMIMLSSCVGEEPDNIAYVTAIGIDKKDSVYSYTIQFANPTKISGGASEEGGSGGDIVENITVEAATVYSAINNANSIISKDLSLSHAKIFVISEEVAAGGLEGINDVFARNNDIRPDIYYAIAENAGEYLESVKPAIELNPIKYYQLTYDNKNGSGVPQNTAADFYTACLSGDSDCILPLAGVARANDDTNAGGGDEKQSEPTDNESISDAKINEGGFENKTRNYFAGQMGERIKNKSEVLGGAVFKGDKYVGKIGSIETELYNMLMNRFKENNITFRSNEDEEKPITIQLEEKSRPKYRIDIKNKLVFIDISLEGELLSASDEYKHTDSMKKMTADAASMVSEAATSLIYKLYEEYNTDALGICGRVKRQLTTTDEYDAFKAGFVPSEWSFAVNTDLKTELTGMTAY